MSEIQDQIRQVESEIETLKEHVANRDLAMKLYENREFKKLFIDEYFVKEAARLVQLSADPSLDERQRADALSMAQATGHARRYLSIIVQMGNRAAQDIREMEQGIEELRAAEAAE